LNVTPRERQPKPAAYHLLSAPEKRMESLARVREPAVTCPTCDMQVMPDDLLAHMDVRCPGPRDPGPGARWINWRQARELAPAMSLIRWVERGFVRTRGDRGDRQYLHRDLALKVAQLRGFRRR
jgi:hypothetical protein